MMKKFVAFALIAVLAAAQVPSGAMAGDDAPSHAAAARAEAAKMKAAKIKMMRMQQAQARAAQAGMAAAVVTAATLAATDAGECSPYLARWMTTRSLAAKAAYEACRDD